ncbi:hypothetical protein ACN47E_007588 [Coniothyrium glycines]
MRLLRRQSEDSYQIVSFNQNSLPSYAILSHTWTEDQEVTYDELISGTRKDKAGCAKLRFCSDRASEDHLEYFWVDTCCINKSTSDELSTAINSMFRWYQRASKCYVYLSDVSSLGSASNTRSNEESWTDFEQSRWFTRGWTLQELLAPSIVEFYSREGNFIGSKQSLEHSIQKITHLPIGVLRGQSFASFSVEERLSWAANRTTTIQEDKIYCMLGIFEVFLPLIYGEGEAYATLRLREEIQKRQPSASGPGPSVSLNRHNLKRGVDNLQAVSKPDRAQNNHDSFRIPKRRLVSPYSRKAPGLVLAGNARLAQPKPTILRSSNLTPLHISDGNIPDFKPFVGEAAKAEAEHLFRAVTIIPPLIRGVFFEAETPSIDESSKDAGLLQCLENIEHASYFLEYLESLSKHDGTLSENQVDDVQRDRSELRDKQERRSQALAHQRMEKRRQILFWISSLDYTSVQDETYQTRHGNTGTWFLNHYDFQKWIHRDTSSLLWCWGNPGSGKTILASVVQEHISSLHKRGSGTGTAFVYCTYREPMHPTKYILSYLRQLLAQLPDLPDGVEDRFDALYKDGHVLCQEDIDLPTEHDAWRVPHHSLFTDVVEKFSRVFLIFDALDECQGRSAWLTPLLTGLIQRYSDQDHGVTIKIFVTSRREHDISRAFESVPTIAIRANNVRGDIESYVEHEVRVRLQNGDLELQDVKIANTIKRVLVSRANGMFLWVKYHLDHLCDQVTDQRILGELISLPETLHEHYDRIMRMINGRTPGVRTLVRKVVQYLSCAGRKLHWKELLEAVAIQDTSSSFHDLDIISSPDRVLHACHNLIEISADGAISFVHYSVQEYFVSDHLRSSADSGARQFHVDLGSAHLALATTSLKYLSFPDVLEDFASDPVWIEKDFPDVMSPSSRTDTESLKSRAFLPYAAEYLAFHLTDTQISGHAITEATLWFNKAFENSKVLEYIQRDQQSGWYAKSSLQLASKLKLGRLLKELVSMYTYQEHDREKAFIIAYGHDDQSSINTLLSTGVHMGVASPGIGWDDFSKPQTLPVGVPWESVVENHDSVPVTETGSLGLQISYLPTGISTT